MKGMAGTTWMLGITERETYWSVVHDIKETFKRLRIAGNLPADWNQHDTGIVTELEKQARPFKHNGEQQRDPNTAQLRKHHKATAKILKTQGVDLSFKEYVKLLGISRNNTKLTPWEIKVHMDERRHAAGVYCVELNENRKSA